MGTIVDTLRNVVGRINLVIAHSNAVLQTEHDPDSHVAHLLNFACYTAIHDVLEVIITELEADDGSRRDSSKNIIH